MALYGGIGAAVLVVGGLAAYFMMKPAPAPPPAPPPSLAVATTLPAPETVPPEPVAASPSPPEEVVTVATPPPTTAPAQVAVAVPTPPPATQPPKPAPTPVARPTPSARPSPSARPAGPATPAAPAAPTEAQLAQQRAAQVTTLLGQADAAVAANKLDQAASLFDEALKLDPQNAKATSGKAAALAGAASLKKAFNPGRTSFIGKEKKGPAGFGDNEPADPDYQGRIEYEFAPPNVKPGDQLSAKIFFVNEGKKIVKLNTMTVTTVVNGQRSPGPSSPQTKDVTPGQRALLASVTAAWKDGTTSWSLEVVVTSARAETYTSRASWR